LRIKIPDDIKVQPGATICAGEQVQLSASGMIAYEWMPNNGLDNPFVPEPFCLPPYSITYKVKGFDGCYYDSAFVEVKINDAEPVDAGSDLQTFANNPVQLQAAGLGSFTWFPAEGLSCVACSDPMATVANTTTYVVSNYNPDGCRTDDTVVVHVSCAESLVFVPNAFTPNGDGKNERFYVRTKGLKNLDFFRVFTRTGELVFETTNADEGWDGTFKGCALPPGVFSYNVLATCAEDGKIEFNGNVTLIR
ncbi:MAG TPA: gliding motility-associated C-terminal domain-containing protein, partial [Chitinophagales bacterium]|nr:gliding motility-associated C-terminal domain-containing protein [Chitinophagales bacterium]